MQPAQRIPQKASVNTRSAPFRLSADARPAPPTPTTALTTEERRLEELRARKAEEAKQRRRVLARMTTSPKAAHAAPSPKVTKVVPFRLASVALHEQEMLNRHRAQKVRPAGPL